MSVFLLGVRLAPFATIICAYARMNRSVRIFDQAISKQYDHIGCYDECENRTRLHHLFIQPEQAIVALITVLGDAPDNARWIGDAKIFNPPGLNLNVSQLRAVFD